MNNTNTTFMRRLIISYSILLIVILIMGVYLYTVSIDNVGGEIRTQNKLMLEKTIANMDTSFRTMEALSGQIVENSNITQLSNMESNNDKDFYIKSYHAKEDLSVYVFTESMLPISTYYIYLQKPDYVLSSSQFSESELYYKGIKNYYNDKYEEWIKVLNNEDFYRKFIPIDQYKAYSDSSYLYMMPLTEISPKNIPAIICFEINYGALLENFNELSYYESGYLTVLDSNNNLVFSVNGRNRETAPIEPLLNLEYKNGFSQFSESGENMFVTKMGSDKNDWQYYLVQPRKPSLYSLEQYRDIFITIFLVGLMIVVVLILFLSRTNINKITQLGNQLTTTMNLQESLQIIVEKQKPIIMNTYLAKIIEGNISNQQELEYAQQYLNINTENKKYAVLYMVAYMNQYELSIDNSAVTGPDNQEYVSIIEKAVVKFFGDAIGVIKNDEKAFSILISRPSHETSEASSIALVSMFKAFHNEMLNNHDIWLFGGLGDWNTGLMMIWRSFQQANQSISYTTKKDVFCCYSGIEKDTNSFYYPTELINQLSFFITSSSETQILEVFEIIRQENMEARSLPITTMKYLLSDIRNSLYKIRYTIKETDENRNELKVIDELFENETTVKLCGMTLKFCEDIAVRLSKCFDSPSSGNKLIEKIREYIDQNYYDPSLCLSKISDEFSISESYFSYLFKEEIGKKFSYYLEEKRMNHAMDKIKNTDMSLGDISIEVGYNNGHTFRRAFKKVYGMTPKDARTL